MPYERTGYAPWSLTREAGVQSATVDGTIQVPQYIQPVLSTGFIDENGNWKGTRASDEVFKKIAKETAVPNGQDILAPGGDKPFIDMTGFTDLVIAIKPTNAGNYATVGVMGTDTQPFANLTPVDAAAPLMMTNQDDSSTSAGGYFKALSDNAESMTANVWNIYFCYRRLADQKNLQIKITNNSGGESDIEYGFMRLV